MGKLFSRLFISSIAVAVILVRTFRPDIKVDSTTLLLIGVAISPWLSSVIKGVEVPGGIKLEYRDEGARPIGPSGLHTDEPLSTQQRSPVPKAQGPQDASRPFSDNYIERLVKLTPVEPIVLFIVISSLLRSTPTRAGRALEWSLFGLLVFITPLFYRKVGAAWSQAIAMMLTFCVWIFAIGGPFVTFPWYAQWYGGLLLALFMSVLPLLKLD